MASGNDDQGPGFVPDLELTTERMVGAEAEQPGQTRWPTASYGPDNLRRRPSPNLLRELRRRGEQHSPEYQNPLGSPGIDPPGDEHKSCQAPNRKVEIPWLPDFYAKSSSSKHKMQLELQAEPQELDFPIPNGINGLTGEYLLPQVGSQLPPRSTQGAVKEIPWLPESNIGHGFIDLPTVPEPPPTAIDGQTRNQFETRLGVQPAVNNPSE